MTPRRAFPKPGGAAGHTLGVCGYIAAENLYILYNPAIACPGLQLMTGGHLKKYWRSDVSSDLSGGVLSRPATVIDQLQPPFSPFQSNPTP